MAKHGKTEYSKDRKTVQRALVLQGGGALGAYEAGVLKSWSQKLIAEDRKNNRKGPLFDIIAGVSMGSLNASLLIHRTSLYEKDGMASFDAWEKSVDDLCDFYKKISSPKKNEMMWWIENMVLDNPMFDAFWNSWASVREQMANGYDRMFSHSNESTKELSKEKFEERIMDSPLSPFYYFLLPDKWGVPATPETARKYYSYWNTVMFGFPNVISSTMIQPDMKFLDPLQTTHMFGRFNMNPVIDAMKEYWDYEQTPGIRTGDGETRLLVVSVDIEDCTTATTFDSYSEFTEYGEKLKYRIDLPSGVTIDHIKASMSVDIGYHYPGFEARIREDDGTERKSKRHFWDGAYIGNTPTNEVIQKHRDFWKKKGMTPPDLELYIVNLYPSVEEGIPNSPDAIQDRHTTIEFHDRTRAGIRVSRMRTDYVDLANKLMSVAKKNSPEDVDRILNERAISKTRKGKARTYSDLLKNRFSISKVVYAQRKENLGGTIFGKAFEFSHKTIHELISKGEIEGERSYKLSKEDVSGCIV